MAQPIRDALVYREVSADGSVWDVKRVSLRHIAAHVAGGWTILISTGELEADAISRVRQTEEDRWRRKA